MYRITLNELHRAILEGLTQKEFLKKIKLSEEKVQSLVLNKSFINKLTVLVNKKKIACQDILDLTGDILSTLSFDAPDDWIGYIYQYVLYKSFPASVNIKLNPKLEPAVLIYLEIFKIVFKYESENKEFDKFSDFRFLTEDELNDEKDISEYLSFMKVFEENNIYELFKIGQEVLKYNILEHTAGVHYVAVEIARQLRKVGVDVNLGLLSAAAIGHDIGKFACKSVGETDDNLLYKHLYYTDLFFKRFGMNVIGHIATNHYMKNLEMESLSVESLVLIYANLRVRSKTAKGVAKACIYPLSDAFDMFLNEAGVDDEYARSQYQRIFYKLEDFENYLINLGLDLTLTTNEPKVVEKRDYALLNGQEVVDNLKFLAIEHNITVMNKLCSDDSFANMLDLATSENNWNNIRSYLNVFEEYSIYLTQRQKLVTLSFLYELLTNREGDIRRQSAELIGKIIASFDEEYMKAYEYKSEYEQNDETSLKLWEKYLEMIITPDDKYIEQYKINIQNSLNIFVRSVMNGITDECSDDYLDILLKYFDKKDDDESVSFVLVDALSYIPLKYINYKNITHMCKYVQHILRDCGDELKLISLKYIYTLLDNGKLPDGVIADLKLYLANINAEEKINISYIKYKMSLLLNVDKDIKTQYEAIMSKNKGDIASIFLNNLKSATPWIEKVISIDFILDSLSGSEDVFLLHAATHLCNLIKVSETEVVRNRAGKALLSIGPYLSIDQRNEICVELFKGLEIEGVEFSKYIPEYLGRFALLLHPKELDEFIDGIKKRTNEANSRVCSLCMDTVGVMLVYYQKYRNAFEQTEEEYNNRRILMLGIILSGLSGFDELVRQESLQVIGKQIFGSEILSDSDKVVIFKVVCKKILTLITINDDNDLYYFNCSSTLNHIYRLISSYSLKHGTIDVDKHCKIAFFQDIFDPFSLRQKEIIKKIRALGYDVYLCIDEFSWAYKTQPLNIRKNIIKMSIADEFGVYLFPDNIPVNTGNSSDLKNLRSLFNYEDINIVVYADRMLENCQYRLRPSKNSIHGFNHIIIKNIDNSNSLFMKKYEDIKGKVKADTIELKVKNYSENTDNFMIRDNIDNSRDISSFVDPLVQKFIYERNLYLREPQFKSVLNTKPVRIEIINNINNNIVEEIGRHLFMYTDLYENIGEKMASKDMNFLVVKDGLDNSKLIGFSAFHQISTSGLYQEFKSFTLAGNVRKITSGKILVIDGVYINQDIADDNIEQFIITETLAYCLKNDYTYAMYFDVMFNNKNSKIYDVLELQGFRKLEVENQQNVVYAVDMKFPICVTYDVESLIKEPLASNQNVKNVIENTRKKLQRAFTKLYPGSLVLYFSIDMIRRSIVDKFCEANKVPVTADHYRGYGEYMCVPFGGILRDIVVPNTVTKTLYTEKAFRRDIDDFKIVEYPFYAKIEDQIKVIKSFDKSLILVDDLLNKGYRIREISSAFKSQGVDIRKIIVGILSGNGKDLMDMKGIEVDSAYFIPNLRLWFNESLLYPFIGGDLLQNCNKPLQNLIPSINLILPYVAPSYIKDVNNDDVYNLSMTCVHNAKEILQVLELEYQKIYEKNLTLRRLGEVLKEPRYPDKGKNIYYDLDVEPSSYIENDIENLERIGKLLK